MRKITAFLNRAARNEEDEEIHRGSGDDASSGSDVELVEEGATSSGRKRRQPAKPVKARTSLTAGLNKQQATQLFDSRRKFHPEWGFDWAVQLSDGTVGCTACGLLHAPGYKAKKHNLKVHSSSGPHKKALEKQEMAEKAAEARHRWKKMVEEAAARGDERKLKQFIAVLHMLRLGRPMTNYEEEKELLQRLQVEDLPENYWTDDSGWIIACSLEEMVRRKVAEEVRKSEFISFSLDDSTAVDNTSYMCVHVYYVEGFRRRAELVKLAKIREAPDAAYLARLLLSTLTATLGLSVAELAQKAVGLGADGAGVMMGEHSGVLTRMVQMATPFAVAIWCMAHRTNLAAAVLTSCSVLGKVNSAVSAAHTYHSTSAKRQTAFAKFAETAGTRGLQLLNACDTRWLSLEPTAARLYSEHPAIALQAATESAEAPGDQRPATLAGQLLDVELLIGICAVLPLLGLMQAFIKSCQERSAYVGSLLTSLQTTRRRIREQFVEPTTAYGGIVFSQLDDLLAVGSDRSCLVLEAESNTLQLLVGTAEPLELTAVKPPTGQAGRPYRRQQQVTTELLSEVKEYVKRQVTSAAGDVLAALAQRFPPDQVLSSLRMVYPDYWETGAQVAAQQRRDDFQQAAAVLREQFGTPAPAPPGLNNGPSAGDGVTGVPAAPALKAPINIDLLSEQFYSFATEAQEQAVSMKKAGVKPEEGTFVAFWEAMCRNRTFSLRCSEWIRLAKLAATIVPGSVEAERVFSTMNFIKDKQRNRLGEPHLNAAVRLNVQGWYNLDTFPYAEAMAYWRDNATWRWAS